MKAYKGFDKDFKCRDFQYEVGKEYFTDNAEVCNCGFRACKDPLDVLNHYSLLDDDANLNRFAEVDADEDDTDLDGDSKFASKRIKIKAELSLKGLICAAVNFIFEKTEKAKTKDKQGDSSQLAASGDYSIVAGIGYSNICKATKGSWIVLAEYDDNKIPICVKSAQVDGKKIKADTWYELKNGEFTEVKE